MYKDPYSNKISTNFINMSEEIDKKIKEEEMKMDKADRLRILKLKEQKYVGGLFDNTYIGGTLRFRSPW